MILNLFKGADDNFQAWRMASVVNVYINLFHDKTEFHDFLLEDCYIIEFTIGMLR